MKNFVTFDELIEKRVHQKKKSNKKVKLPKNLQVANKVIQDIEKNISVLKKTHGLGDISMSLGMLSDLLQDIKREIENQIPTGEE